MLFILLTVNVDTNTQSKLIYLKFTLKTFSDFFQLLLQRIISVAQYLLYIYVVSQYLPRKEKNIKVNGLEINSILIELKDKPAR